MDTQKNYDIEKRQDDIVLKEQVAEKAVAEKKAKEVVANPAGKITKTSKANAKNKGKKTHVAPMLVVHNAKAKQRKIKNKRKLVKLSRRQNRGK